MTSILGSVVKIGGSILGAGSKKKASKKAQAAYDAKAQEAIAGTKAAQDQELARIDPYATSGRVGLDALTKGISSGDYTRPFTLDDFHTDPGYQFRLDEGERALSRSLGARGSAFSGAQLRGAQDYGQNAASDEYGAAYNRFTGEQDRAYNKDLGLTNIGYNAALGGSNVVGQNNALNNANLLDIGGNDSGSIRERGAITAGMWSNIANEAAGAIASFGTGGGGSGGASLSSIFKGAR